METTGSRASAGTVMGALLDLAVTGGPAGVTIRELLFTPDLDSLRGV